MPAPRLAAVATLFVVGFCKDHEAILPVEIGGILLWLRFLLWYFLRHKKPCPEDTGQGYVMLLQGQASTPLSLH